MHKRLNLHHSKDGSQHESISNHSLAWRATNNGLFEETEESKRWFYNDFTVPLMARHGNQLRSRRNQLVRQSGNRWNPLSSKHGVWNSANSDTLGRCPIYAIGSGLILFASFALQNLWKIKSFRKLLDARLLRYNDRALAITKDKIG